MRNHDMTWIASLYEVGSVITEAVRDADAIREQARLDMVEAKRIYQQRLKDAEAMDRATLKRVESLWTADEIAAAKMGAK